MKTMSRQPSLKQPSAFPTLRLAMLALLSASTLHAATFTVTSTADSGAGTLRQAFISAAAAGGQDTINFSLPAGSFIFLSSEIVVDDAAGVTVDAVSSGGVTLVGIGGRHFYVNPGKKLTLRGLYLLFGNGAGLSSSSGGGSIYNDDGILLVERCTFAFNNTTSTGGAIFSNTDPIFVVGGPVTSTELTNCTLFFNTADLLGGGIYNAYGRTKLTHCTVTENFGGGALACSTVGNTINFNTVTWVKSSIVAGNTGGDVEFHNGAVNPFSSSGGNLIGTGNATGAFQSGDSINHTSATLKLGPLFNYGGPAPTLRPLPGSPAIDFAGSGTTLDQRGQPRAVDGDGIGGAAADSGAVELQRVVVNTVADENNIPAGASISLREAVRDGADLVNFALNAGDTVTLSLGTALVPPTPGWVIVDAGDTSGQTIDGGPGDNRLFTVTSGAGLTLRGLTMTGGNGDAPAGGSEARGGAVSNESGTLLIDRCTLTGNTADDGGAIYSNTAPITGSVTSSTTITHCTITGNTLVNGLGSAFRNKTGRAILTHCTITGNTASGSSAVFSAGNIDTETIVSNSIIAANAITDADFSSSGVNSFTSLGGNLIGIGTGSPAFNQPGDSTGHTAGTIKLAPLADYGGPTRTMALAAGSPARNSATGPTPAGDQRGFPIVGVADIGAYEAGTFTNYNAYIYEYLPATATAAEHASTFDFDNDGDTNGAEFDLLTDPSDSGEADFAATIVRSGTNVVISFPTSTDKLYTLWRSDTLDPGFWINTNLPTVIGDGTLRSFTLPAPTPGVLKRYFRVQERIGDGE